MLHLVWQDPSGGSSIVLNKYVSSLVALLKSCLGRVGGDQICAGTLGLVAGYDGVGHIRLASASLTHYQTISCLGITVGEF